MLKTIAGGFALLLLSGCSSQKKTTSSAGLPARESGLVSKGNTRTTTVEYISNDTYLLQTASEDPSYGYTKENPVKVGGSKENSGPVNERRFMNALLGPAGEQVVYQRTGSCCAFTTPNGLFDNTGMLDRYRLYWKGGKDTLVLYLNMYDYGDLLVPKGLTAKK